MIDSRTRPMVAAIADGLILTACRHSTSNRSNASAGKSVWRVVYQAPTRRFESAIRTQYTPRAIIDRLNVDINAALAGTIDRKTLQAFAAAGN